MASNPKRVSNPTQISRAGGIKQVKSGIIEGPTATEGNLQPYNRKKK
ncbi:MAG: hypothetical protein QME16_00155 [Planctomycetota bacterium]|nr:hypothetical protein [Planctomycetota bacterium]